MLKNLLVQIACICFLCTSYAFALPVPASSPAETCSDSKQNEQDKGDKCDGTSQADSGDCRCLEVEDDSDDEDDDETGTDSSGYTTSTSPSPSPTPKKFCMPKKVNKCKGKKLTDSDGEVTQCHRCGIPSVRRPDSRRVINACKCIRAKKLLLNGSVYMLNFADAEVWELCVNDVCSTDPGVIQDGLELLENESNEELLSAIDEARIGCSS